MLQEAFNAQGNKKLTSLIDTKLSNIDVKYDDKLLNKIYNNCIYIEK